MAQGSGFQLLIMTDLYPATTLSFLHFFCLHSLCLALIMSFTCSVVASLGSLVAAPILHVLLFSFCCSTICLKKNVLFPFLPLDLVNGVPWSSEGPRRNSHTFNCRMLVNPHGESQEEPHEHEPQQQKYETMQCFAVSEPKSIKEEGDGMQGGKNGD